jgi:HEAT repeat protein
VLSFLSEDALLDVEATVKNILSVKSENVRFATARAFKEVGNPEFALELKDFLKIDEVENSEELKKILKRVSRKDDMEQLVATLAKMDEKTCLELIVALKKGKNVVESQERLARIFRMTEDKKVKGIVIRIIGLAKAQAAIPLLQECLKDPDKRVRANAVEALSEIGGDYVIELLKPMINDYDNRVKANAAKGLWALGGVRSLQILRDMMTAKDKWMRAAAAYALGEIGVIQTVDLLIQSLNDPEVDVRVNVVKALARTGDLVALNNIMDVVRNKSEEWPVRKNAIISIGRTRVRKGIEFLENLLADASEPQLARETIQLVLDEIRS